MLDFLLMTSALKGAYLQMLMEPCYASAVLIREPNLPGSRNVNNKLSQIISSLELNRLEFGDPLQIGTDNQREQTTEGVSSCLS